MSVSNSYKLILLLILLLNSSLYSYSQEFVLFSRHQGIPWKKITPQIILSENEVTVGAKDTTVSIFNLYYTSDSTRLYHLQSKDLKLQKNGLKALSNDILITLVPLVSPGESLRLKKITNNEFKKLNVVSHTQLLSKALPKLYAHATQDLYTMPSLKSREYHLVIQENGNHYLVEQPVISVIHLICADNWYFPNQFKEGIISVAQSHMKAYTIGDIRNIQTESNNNLETRKQVYNRIYFSGMDKTSVPGLSVYNYWEMLNDDAWSIKVIKGDIKQYHPGLGSFSFLPKIGIVNCTLDYYLKGEIRYNQRNNFKIQSVNGFSPTELGKKIIAKNSNIIVGVH